MIEVVGVRADGPDEAARRLLADAEVVLGGERHLAMARALGVEAELIPWPSPMRPALPGLIASVADRRVVVLASGDPMVSGIGSTLVRLLGPAAVRIRPAASSVALARAEMRWPEETCDFVSLVGRDLDRLRRHLAPGNRVIALSGGAGTPAAIADLLRSEGFGPTRMTVLSDLGSADQARFDGVAEDWPYAAVPPLNVLCLEVAVTAGARPVGLSLAPGLPDEDFEHDGQLSKRDVRASALAHLRPCPGDLLWDVGAGAGSIGIEWSRLDRRNRAIAVERDAERADRIRRNAARLGVPELRVVQADATIGLADLPTPDAVFVGGGANAEVIEACWAALPVAGRIVVHTVTLETERAVIDAWQRHGGELTRLSVEVTQPIGRFTGWKPARPVVQWAAAKRLPIVEETA
ncbi:precorrin-6y C5,15-methyltransferase (decarboxylating) subunit CbiE [Raineyella sp. W15-4]|uniref:precorrin-6y C5,15-methyltransferase (decarboxylating) subunit CbiE n=1 Tax=Raineyella sp. W15-4 TaxID=3081651 RepID=UPI0029537F08|nr:precorrin-6y C5,15-methyltransferase (decarboxylating) subunit CbiE [Raineyella sp. W15-4]WOQ16825.1 precorrin-6y C5,15-methyltransferase (decarboxylating) subunit CbiE [Raineyella sp. W15-4]